ncbi:hypothetical protein AAFN47_08685 [Hoeflea sp. CAU 1731]
MYVTLEESRHRENTGQGKPASPRPIERPSGDEHYLDKLERINHFRKRLSW